MRKLCIEVKPFVIVSFKVRGIFFEIQQKREEFEVGMTVLWEVGERFFKALGS